MGLAPVVGGVEPERTPGDFHEFIARDNTIVGVLYPGIRATGEPSETLLGTAEDHEDEDEDELPERFAAGAEAEAMRQGSSFNYETRFARVYPHAWRWAVVRACEEAAAAAAAADLRDRL